MFEDILLHCSWGVFALCCGGPHVSAGVDWPDSCLGVVSQSQVGSVVWVH